MYALRELLCVDKDTAIPFQYFRRVRAKPIKIIGHHSKDN